MPDLFNEKNSNNIFDNAVKDDAMDLSEFITTPTTQKPTVETSPIDSALSDNTPKSNKELSPLAAELNKKKNAQLGATVTRKEMEDGKERTVFENPMADERRERMKATMDESEMLLKQRAAIIPLKQFESSTEYSQMVHEISLVRFDETGKAYFDYEKDSNGNNVIPKFIRLRTENDPPYSKENDYLVMNRDAENARRIADGKEPIPDSVPLTAKVEDIEHKEEEDTKSKTINLIIDKTGLGTDFILSEDERKKMAEANEIRLTQVEVLDIASITTEKPERDSFTGKINTYQLSGSKTTISFPASGFKADMTGLTYGEIADISLSMDAVNVDKYYKRLAIIYNKMKNISNGPFDSFEDFLKNFAYTDISLAVYGLFVATFPEVQTISLRCGRNSCNKTFDWDYATRSILRLDKSDEVLLNKMAQLASADPNEYEDIYKKAAVRNSKFIKLPYSGYIVELGIASAYEFLYNFIPVIDDETFKQAFGNDINDVYKNNMLLLTTVLSVRIPKNDNPNSYILCEGYKDIVDAIYSISPEEIKIIATMSNKIQTQYQVNYSFGDVKCPHCGNVTKDLDLTIDDLVFQTYQRLISTEIDLTNIQGL
jgi:hypothetical protein